MKVIGMDKAILTIKNIEKLIPSILEEIYSELNISRNNILQSMRSTPRQLRTINVPGRKKVYHHPAQQGSPPAIMNGALSGSLTIAQSIAGKGMDFELGTTVKYGPKHEGTDGHIGHHPYMKPELNNLLGRVPKSLSELIRNANR